MDPGLTDKGVVFIDWPTRTFRYRTGDEMVSVRFEEVRRNATDLFLFCCSIAIAQERQVKEANPTSWRGADLSFLWKVTQAFGWRLESPGSWRNYWSQLPRGVISNRQVAEIKIVDRHGNERRGEAFELFPGHTGYVLGRPVPVGPGQHRLWSVEFLAVANPGAQEDLKSFQCRVARLCEGDQDGTAPPSIPQLLDAKGAEFREAVSRPANGARPAKPDLLKYLQPMTRVLRIAPDKSSDSKKDDKRWFRKSGPIQADFDGDRVYTREQLLKDLENHVRGNPLCMLVGAPATGKTVLVRQLAHRLCCEGSCGVYHFSCDLQRDFDAPTLAGEINGVTGIVIIEDVHLSPRNVQLMGTRLEQNQRRHVLLTTRPSLRNHMYSRLEDLTNLPALWLEPFRDVDGLIEHFASKHADLSWDSPTREALKAVSAKSLWLLAYALQGYAKRRGLGNPRGWQSEGVQADLRDLEEEDPRFPEIVVALSPLYQNEILTAEKYLIGRWGFDLDALRTLHRRGEITAQIVDGAHTLYGLPHSGLAHAYWSHGRVYRERLSVGSLRELLVDYAAVDAPNALEAVMGAEEPIKDEVLSQLDARGITERMVTRSRSAPAMDRWLEYTAPKYDGTGSWPEVVAKIVNASDAYGVGSTLSLVYWGDSKAGDAIWERVDGTLLAQKFSRPSSFQNAGIALGYLRRTTPRRVEDIGKSIDIQTLSQLVNATDAPEFAVFYLGKLSLEHSPLAQQVFEHVNLDRFASAFGTRIRISAACVALAALRLMDNAAFRVIKDAIPISEWAEFLSQSADPIDGLKSVRWLFHTDRRKARSLRENVVTKDWWGRLMATERPGIIAAELSELAGVNKTAAREVCAKMEVELLEAALRLWGVPWEYSACVSSLYAIHRPLGRWLWAATDKEDLSRKCDEADLVEIEPYLACITGVSPCIAEQMLEVLDQATLNEKLEAALRKDFGDIEILLQQLKAGETPGAEWGERLRELCGTPSMQILADLWALDPQRLTVAEEGFREECGDLSKLALCRDGQAFLREVVELRRQRKLEACSQAKGRSEADRKKDRDLEQLLDDLAVEAGFMTILPPVRKKGPLT